MRGVRRVRSSRVACTAVRIRARSCTKRATVAWPQVTALRVEPACTAAKSVLHAAEQRRGSAAARQRAAHAAAQRRDTERESPRPAASGVCGQHPAATRAFSHVREACIEPAVRHLNAYVLARQVCCCCASLDAQHGCLCDCVQAVRDMRVQHRVCTYLTRLDCWRACPHLSDRMLSPRGVVPKPDATTLQEYRVPQVPQRDAANRGRATVAVGMCQRVLDWQAPACAGAPDERT